MKKSELVADLNNRVIKVITAHPPIQINGGDKEYTFTCVIEQNGGFREDNFHIRVVNEGLENENAGYVDGRQPPSLINREMHLKNRLLFLQSIGDLKLLDISKLDIKYAKIKLAGEIKFALELNGELFLVDGE